MILRDRQLPNFAFPRPPFLKRCQGYGAAGRRNSCRDRLRRYDSPRMSKAEKLAFKILSGKSDQNFGFDDLCHVIERAGFQLRSGNSIRSTSNDEPLRADHLLEQGR